MDDATIEAELSDCLEKMPIEQQRQVLEFARALVTRSPQGVPGRTLLQFAGRIDKSDLDAMSQAIEEGCERIEADGW